MPIMHTTKLPTVSALPTSSQAILQGMWGAPAQSLHLLLSWSWVCCRDVQTQVEALGASLLQQLLCGLCEASCPCACRQYPTTGAWALRILDLGWAGVEGKVRYPSAMDSTIKWPEGATPHALILKKHDLSMMRSSVRQLTAQASASPHLSIWRRLSIFCKRPTSTRTTSASQLSFGCACVNSPLLR